jgi:hypothetical protein
MINNELYQAFKANFLNLKLASFFDYLIVFFFFYWVVNLLLIDLVFFSLNYLGILDLFLYSSLTLALVFSVITVKYFAMAFLTTFIFPIFEAAPPATFATLN